MSRRTLTLLLSTALAVGLTLLAFMMPVPYVLLKGGPVFNTTGAVQGTPVITISGRQTYPTDGQLDLTTVGVNRSITLAEAFKGWFDRSEAVSPKEIYFPPGKTEQQIDAQNTQDMVTSQNSAKTAALVALGIPVTVTVQAVTQGSPAQDKLQPGDEFVAVDGKAVTSPNVLRQLISARKVGDPVVVTVTRDATRMDVTLTTAGTPTGSVGGAEAAPQRPVIGVTPAVTRYPFTVKIALEDVGGPSAGLMFALGIIDKLGPDSLTKGKHIAGTGTIDDDGLVGPIGGIQQKIAAAGKQGVEVFLVPDENCADAQSNRPDGVELVRITTLDQARKALQTIADGGTPQGCG